MDITSSKFIGAMTYPEVRSLLEEREDFQRGRFPQKNIISGEE